MARLLRDFRLALKALRRRPMFAVLVVTTLALGVGTATAIFSVVNGVLLSGLDHEDSEQLVMFRLYAGEVDGFPSVSPGELELFQDESSSFSLVAGATSPFPGYAVIEGQAVPITTSLVSADMFPMLGVRPALGRLFTEDDEKVPFGQNGSTVISYEMWQRHFGGDPGVIGKPLRGEGGPAVPAPEIVGVLPPGFTLEMGPRTRMSGTVDNWLANRIPVNWSNRFLRTIGRLAPGVTIEQAQREVDVMIARVLEDHPEAHGDGSDARFQLVPLHNDIVKDVRPAILILFAAVGLVFLVACGNAASVLLARTTMRQSELAVHNALGAGRQQIARLVLAESVVLAGLAGALGTGLAWLGIKGLLLIDPGTIPLVDRVALNPTVLLFATGAALVATLLFGMLPAYHASSARTMNDSLRHGARMGGALAKGPRQALVVFQVAFSIVLLTATGLLVRTFVNLQTTDLGYLEEGLTTFRARLDFQRFNFNQPDQIFSVYRQLIDRVEQIPGVQHASGINILPLDGRNNLLSFTADGQTDGNSADLRHVMPGYFEAMRIPLLAGRAFTDADNTGPQQVIVIDDMLAERTWPGEDPLGKWLSWNFNNQDRRFQVIGVVGHSRIGSVDDPGRPQVYAPFTDNPGGALSVVVRSDRAGGDLIPALSQAAEQVNTGRVIDQVVPLTKLVDDSVAAHRFALLLMGSLGAVAILLTIIGVYGTVSYLVALRTREMGIRVALGAQTNEVVRLNLREGLVLTAAGVLVGSGVMIGIGRFMSALLYGVTATDPVTYLATGVAVLALALLASFVPAWRASRVQPLAALREE